MQAVDAGRVLLVDPAFVCTLSPLRHRSSRRAQMSAGAPEIASRACRTARRPAEPTDKNRLKSSGLVSKSWQEADNQASHKMVRFQPDPVHVPVDRMLAECGYLLALASATRDALSMLRIA